MFEHAFWRSKWKRIAQLQAKELAQKEEELKFAKERLGQERSAVEDWRDIAFNAMRDTADLKRERRGDNTPFEQSVYNWSNHNWPNRTPLSILGNLTEETGEVARCITKAQHGIKGTPEFWDNELKDEIGDVAINLIDLCAVKGWSFGTIVNQRFEKVKVRDWQRFPKNGITE
jgi:NTP pyrophosphatase (non-canonical NTP hydrolase)